MGEATDAALINYSGQLLNSSMNYAAQANINRKTRKYNEAMYSKQRADSLADWTMQNEYNSPASQMARLREAGLNPNLVYGKGADNTAMAVRSTDTKSWNPSVPAIDANPSNALMTYYDVQMKQAQIDNLKVANTVQTQEAILKAAQTAGILQSTKSGEFDLGLKSDLRQYTMDAAKENLRKLTSGTDIMLQQNERDAAMNSSNLMEAMERVLTLRANRVNTEAEREKIYQSIELLKKENRIKRLDAQLADENVRPGENLFMQVLRDALNYVTEGAKGKGFIEKGVDKVKEKLEWDKPWKERSWRLW